MELFYVSRHALPDLQSSMYFSAVTYTTTGYGEVCVGDVTTLVASRRTQW